MTLSVKHASLTGAGANPDVLVDGPKWDAEHTVTGLENVPNVDTTNATNLSSGTVPAGRLANSGKPFVLLFSGQSNPELAPVYAWTPNDNAQIWNGGREGVTGTAFAALQRATIIFPAKIASDIADNNLTRPVYLINVVQSGTTISHWLSGTGAPDVYVTLKREIEAALALIGVARIDAFGWWQGENDAIAGSTTYRTDFESLITRLRAETWFPRETPTLICSICSIANGGYVNADALNDTLLSLVSADPDVRRYLNSNILTGATYWDVVTPGHMTGQGYFSAGALAAHTLLNGWGRGSPFNIMVDPATGKVNVGTYGAPDSLLTVNNNTGSSAALPFQADLHLVATDLTIGGVLSHVYSGQTLFTGVASGGSRASRSALGSGVPYLGLLGQTYDGSASASNATLEFLTVNAQSVTDHSSRARLRLTPTTSTTLTDVMLWGPGVAIGSGAADPGVGNLNLGGGKLQNNGTDPTGTGAYVRATSPALVTPALGVATATSLNGNTFTTGTYTLTGAAGKTFTFSNTLTLSGTDGTTMTLPTTNATLARTDAGQTFTGTQVFSSTITGSISGNAATVTTNANLTGDVTSVGNATTLTNAPVIAKVLTGYTSGAGTVSATDSILSAIQKLNGNDATNANLTGDVTSVGNATTLAAGSASNLNSGTLLAARMPAHTGDVTSSAGSVALTLAAGSASVLNSGTLLAARMPALTGDITSSAGAVATTLAAGNAGNLNSGTLLAARMPALTGDVTTSAGAVATTVTKINGVDQTAAWTSYTPTVTANVGAITTYTSNTSAYKTIGKTVLFNIIANITAINTGSGNFTTQLPVTPLLDGSAFGNIHGTGVGLSAIISAGSTTITVTNYAGAAALNGNGEYVISGSYQSS